MRALIRRMETLLSEHDCVIVPGLGGFVQNEASAYYDEKEALYYPAAKQIGFNAKLSFNDGLLAQSYQEDFHIGFEEANARIRAKVDELNALLDEGKYLTLGSIGYMHRSEDGITQFRPYKQNLLDAGSAGLKAVSEPVRASLQTAKEISGNTAKWAIAVAACFLFMLLTYPLQYNGRQKNEASVLSMFGKMEDKAYVEAFHLNKAKEIKNEEAEVASEEVLQGTVQECMVTTESKKEDAISFSNSLSAKSVSKGRYHIVVACFKEASVVPEWIQKQLLSDYPNAGYVQGKQYSRVYVESFDNKEDALCYLKQIRVRDKRFSKAWIFANE